MGISVLLVANAGGVTAFSSNCMSQRTDTVGLVLWGEPSRKDGESGDMSQALPFAPRPKSLDGTMPGDCGFDPFGFAKDKESLIYMREAEIRHSRLAMLAVLGWPLA